jgi:hypothetical protein
MNYRNLLEQALEALKSSEKYLPAGHEHAAVMIAIAALKEAIAKQSEPVVYWNGKGSIIPAEDISYLPNWDDYYPIPLYTSAPTIPEGWQLVPKEPTPTQVRCGQLGVTTTCAIAVYKAMLSAAPTHDGTLRVGHK